MNQIMNSEMKYAEDCLSGLGMKTGPASQRIKDISMGDPVGLEAVIDIEYGFGLSESKVGPPWMMGDWRTAAKLVHAICKLGSTEDRIDGVSNYDPERILKLWPIEIDKGVPDWDSKRRFEMLNGKIGYSTSAKLGAEVQHAMCKNSGISDHASMKVISPASLKVNSS